MNTVSVIGRITKDVELKYTSQSTAVAQVNIAVKRVFKKEGQPEADFIPVVVWKKNAENLAKYAGSKGSLIAVVGRLQTRTYESQGKKHFVMELIADTVEFLGSKDSSKGNSNNNQNDVPSSEFNDDLPF